MQEVWPWLVSVLFICRSALAVISMSVQTSKRDNAECKPLAHFSSIFLMHKMITDPREQTYLPAARHHKKIPPTFPLLGNQPRRLPSLQSR